MKIIYLITKGNWGGAQKYVFELASRLPRPGWNVLVAHGEGDILPHKLSTEGIQTVRIPKLGRDVSVLKDTLSFFDIYKIFRRERPDVVHLNSSKIGGIGSLAARLAGVSNIIFTVHGFAFNENRPWIQRKIIAILSWLSIVFSTKVIFISSREYGKARAWPFITQKAVLIPNGVAPINFLDAGQARASLLHACGATTDALGTTTLIGSIAELTPNKGLIYALEALKELPYCSYIIVGKGELEPSLREYIQKHHLENRVFLAGFVDNASRYLKAFDIFLLPSIKEGVPYVILEAGLAERAVVATRVGGIPEVITNEVSGLLVEPKNSDALQKALQSLATHPENCSRFGTALAHTVHEHFLIDTMVDKTLTQYKANSI